MSQNSLLLNKHISSSPELQKSYDQSSRNRVSTWVQPTWLIIVYHLFHFRFCKTHILFLSYLYVVLPCVSYSKTDLLKVQLNLLRLFRSFQNVNETKITTSIVTRLHQAKFFQELQAVNYITVLMKVKCLQNFQIQI